MYVKTSTGLFLMFNYACEATCLITHSVFSGKALHSPRWRWL